MSQEANRVLMPQFSPARKMAKGKFNQDHRRSKDSKRF